MNTFLFLNEVKEECIELSKRFSFDKRHPLHFHVVSLYGTILELSSTVVYLSKCETKIALPIVVRSALEATLDLMNLCADPKYGYRLELDFIRNWLDFLGEAKRGENPYLQELSKATSVGDTIKSYKARMKELENHGYKRLDIKEKFQLADMMHEYGSIYSSFCSHTHNSLRALRERHALVQGNDYTVLFFADIGAEEIDYYAGITCELLMRATEATHSLLRTDVREDVSALRERVETFKQCVEA